MFRMEQDSHTKATSWVAFRNLTGYYLRRQRTGGGDNNRMAETNRLAQEVQYITRVAWDELDVESHGGFFPLLASFHWRFLDPLPTANHTVRPLE